MPSSRLLWVRRPTTRRSFNHRCNRTIWTLVICRTPRWTTWSNKWTSQATRTAHGRNRTRRRSPWFRSNVYFRFWKFLITIFIINITARFEWNLATCALSSNKKSKLNRHFKHFLKSNSLMCKVKRLRLRGFTCGRSLKNIKTRKNNYYLIFFAFLKFLFILLIYINPYYYY